MVSMESYTTAALLPQADFSMDSTGHLWYGDSFRMVRNQEQRRGLQVKTISPCLPRLPS